MTAVALVLAVLALLAAMYFSRRSREGRLPGTVVYSDTVERVEEAFVSHRHQLAGKPDYLLHTNGGLVPVEVKSSDRRGRGPLPGDRAQLLAYCLLVEDVMGGPVSHGLLKYASSEFTIPFGDRERAEIVGMLAEMREARGEVHRSHTNPGKCRGCGVRSSCGEALG